jgi:very-short-patch-repair endonuclease
MTRAPAPHAVAHKSQSAPAVWASERARAAAAPKLPVPASIWAPEQVRCRGEAEIVRISERQRGCVHRSQVVAAGIGRASIARRLKTGTLHAIHNDVYLVGRPRLEPLARETATVLHFPGWAVLSHRSAGELWELVEPRPGPVTITAIGRQFRSRRQWLRIHRVPRLALDDIRRRSSLPVTAPARTLIDLAGLLDPLELESALAECRNRELASDDQIAAAIERAPGRTGIGVLRRLLEAPEAARTLSWYERKLLALIRAANLPRPRTNVRVCGHMVDLAWTEQRLVGEFDGWQFHRGRRAFEVDRRRDQDLVAAGWRVIRITARQIELEPIALIARLAVLLR